MSDVIWRNAIFTFYFSIYVRVFYACFSNVADVNMIFAGCVYKVKYISCSCRITVYSKLCSVWSRIDIVVVEGMWIGMRLLDSSYVYLCS